MTIQRYRCAQGGGVVEIDSTRKPLGSGGEGTVYEVLGQPTLAAKVYTKQNPPVRKLQAMLASPPDDPSSGQNHTSIAWPVDLLTSADATRRPVGFVMPRLSGM